MNEKRQEQLLSAAYTDSLTGLPNRRWLDEALEHHMQESPDTTAILFIDLDRLKFANDTEGYQVGDRMIVQAANTIQASIRRHYESRNQVRKSDGVAHGRKSDSGISRAGGDEFVVVLSDITSDSGVEVVIDRIREKLDDDSVEASIGSARTIAGMSVTELLDAAAKSMQRDKTKRKIERLSESQKQAIINIGTLAAHHEIDLRDVPTVLPAISEDSKFSTEDA